MSILPNDLLDALPRLRRYARFLIADPVGAEAIVEAAVSRARHVHYESLPGRTSGVRLLALLRSVYAEQFAGSGSRSSHPSSHPLSSAPPSTPPAQAKAAGSPTGDPPNAGDFLVQLFGLPLEQREVLVLVAVERLSYEDTAALLGVPVATVFARLVQARNALRTAASQRAVTPRSGG